MSWARPRIMGSLHTTLACGTAGWLTVRKYPSPVCSHDTNLAESSRSSTCSAGMCRWRRNRTTSRSNSTNELTRPPHVLSEVANSTTPTVLSFTDHLAQGLSTSAVLSACFFLLNDEDDRRDLRP